MSDRLERDVRFLKRYAVISTLAFGVLAVAAFRQQNPEKVKFTEIDVERINVLEPNGMYRMVISNRPRSIGPIYKGKPFGYEGGGRPGIIIFNDEGTENGGFTFTGSKDASGRVLASTHMSFDQFNQDQILVLNYSEDPRGRVTGISVLDRASVDILDMVNERDSIQKSLAGDTTFAAMLVVNCAINTTSAPKMMTAGLPIRAIRTTGSQIASPKMTMVALVTATPMNAKAVIVGGSPIAWPSACERWLFA